MKEGFLITFEGGEGCGKSTQIKKFARFLEEKGIEYLVSREPGGTEVGEQIRNILLHSKAELSSTVEFLLFSSARAVHIEKIVKPALKQGKVVILDRYYDSSYTYQGLAGDLDLNKLEEITNFAIDGAVPNLTFLLDLTYEQGMARKKENPALANLDRIELKGKTYHDKVRQGYLAIAKRFKDRIVVVDASQSIDKVFQDVVAIFEERYK